ncbi:uncharacterized protein [Primulina eburnea]|uniref:uncharacterized protein n=1 Tax=Primulina eburnea TaxID=1245227 RepID=UPI003C6C2434
MVQQNQFGGTSTADPHFHLRMFLEIADMIKINKVPDDIIILRLFPFSLGDQAKGWLQSRPLGSITTWQELATKFLEKYFPPAMSEQLKIEISTFQQNEYEQLYEAWECYKELLRRCPNHGYKDWALIELFYIGLNGQTQTTVDAAAGGTIFSKSPDQAYNFLEQMTINSYQWPNEISGVKKKAGLYVVDPITSLTAQVSALTIQLAAMNKGQCTSEIAATAAKEGPSMETTHYINNHGYGGYLEGKPYIEDLVTTFVSESSKRMERKETRFDNLETHMANVGAFLKILESQFGQITSQFTSQSSGAVLKTADTNLREVNYIFIQQEEIGMVDGFIQLNAEFQKKKVFEDFKNLHIDIHSADLEEVALTEGVEEIQRNLPQRLQDPGKFVVPCAIWGQISVKIFSGASVNVMSSSLYEKLGLSRMKPTELILQLADKSVNVPLGFVEDVEVHIDKLRLPAYFVVLGERSEFYCHSRTTILSYCWSHH